MADINPGEIAVFYVAFLLALCFHEFAHGWMAKRKGDNTAEVMGRLTMNPTAHLDPLGTVVFPLVALIFHLPLFGWAKPVPVNPRNLGNIKNDMFWVAIAGPASNVILAVVGAFALAIVSTVGTQWSLYSGLKDLFSIFVILNLFLAFFNMIPLYPLDGSKVIARFLPYEWNRKIESLGSTGLMLLFGFFVLGGGRIISGPVYYVAGIMMRCADWLVRLFV